MTKRGLKKPTGAKARSAEHAVPFIVVSDLSKSYQEGNLTRAILKSVNVTFGKGQIVAILGKSGSGKSTFLNLLSGIDTPDGGLISAGDQLLSGLSDHEFTLFRRRHIGFIFQFFNLIPTLTVRENVLLPAELDGMRSKDAQERASELLELVGLSGRDDTFPDRLSGGEQQRVAIARALVHDPMLLLADEPTGNLDEETGTQILKLLERLTRQAGKNLVMVTHSLEAASYADRVFYLQEGQLLEDGKRRL